MEGGGAKDCGAFLSPPAVWHPAVCAGKQPAWSRYEVARGRPGPEGAPNRPQDTTTSQHQGKQNSAGRTYVGQDCIRRRVGNPPFAPVNNRRGRGTRLPEAGRAQRAPPIGRRIPQPASTRANRTARGGPMWGRIASGGGLATRRLRR